MAKRNLSEDQAQSRVIQVNALRKQGKTVAQACAESDITPYCYGYWSRRFVGIKKSRTYTKRKIVVETPAPQPVLVRIWGELSGGKMTLLTDLAA